MTKKFSAFSLVLVQLTVPTQTDKVLRCGYIKEVNVTNNKFRSPRHIVTVNWMQARLRLSIQSTLRILWRKLTS
jgi:hypothetical protein